MRIQCPHPVLGDVQGFSDVADLGCGVGEVVRQIEAVVLFRFLRLLRGCLEEIAEPLQQAVGRLQDLVEQSGGVRVRGRPVELVGESEEHVAVGVGGSLCTLGDVRGLGRLGRMS
ncbi:hypothetical protein HBB06_30495 (plasmid) [Streptomyces sp. SNU607]|uniref:hypothetical protein n=1 Tax=Streptomyces sp. SNU607 TaxID=2718875 RepID=UPI0026DECEEB|nr:hypothetical protein [Streptomyces sp. SNU607]WKV82489.1 hypothetical protein HBB06_30495 [Streptomyces sp. SNU607]